MSYSALLINIVSIFRPTVTYVKGEPTKTYVPVDTDVPCAIQWHKGGSDTQQERIQGYETVEGWFGFFEYGLDIRKDDLITDERSREFVVVSTPEDVTGRYHHIEVGLEIVE